jgi:hypothetical protein
MQCSAASASASRQHTQYRGQNVAGRRAGAWGAMWGGGAQLVARRCRRWSPLKPALLIKWALALAASYTFKKGAHSVHELSL